MSAVFAVSEVPPLPAHGNFIVAPLTLRIRTGQPRALAEEMLNFFRSLISGVIKVNPTKYTILAELIIDYSVSVTKVRMFSSGDIVLVEFQRRSSACSLAHGTVYLAAQRHLTLGGYMLQNPSPMGSLMSLPPPPMEPSDEAADISAVWQMTETRNHCEEGALILWKLTGEGVDVFRCCPSVLDRCLQLLKSSSSFGTRYAVARLLRAYLDLHLGLSILHNRPTRALLTAAAAAPPASVGNQLVSLVDLVDRRWLVFERAIAALGSNRMAFLIIEFLLG